MMRVYVDGEFFTKINTPDELDIVAEEAEIDVSRLTIDADDLASHHAKQGIIQIRKQIETNAGDIPSIVGTIADNVSLIQELLFTLAAAHAEGPEALSSAFEHIAATYDTLKSGVEDGSILMTHRVKGIPATVSEGAARNDAVARTFKALVPEE